MQETSEPSRMLHKSEFSLPPSHKKEQRSAEKKLLGVMFLLLLQYRRRRDFILVKRDPGERIYSGLVRKCCPILLPPQGTDTQSGCLSMWTSSKMGRKSVFFLDDFPRSNLSCYLLRAADITASDKSLLFRQ